MKQTIVIILLAFSHFGMSNISMAQIVGLNNSKQNLDTVYNVHDLDSIPVFSNRIETDIETAIRKELINQIKYPQEAIEKDIQGNVHLTFIIKTNGQIDSIIVISGKNELLDKAAIEGISKLKVTRPGIKNNKPVNTLIYYRIDFHTQ